MNDDLRYHMQASLDGNESFPQVEDDGVDPEDERLNDRQSAQREMIESLAETFGKFDQGSLKDGAHYGPESPFQKDGLVCSSCIFFEGGHGCEVVEGTIEPAGICKLWIIPETLIGEPKAAKARLSARAIGKAIGESVVARRSH